MCTYSFVGIRQNYILWTQLRRLNLLGNLANRFVQDIDVFVGHRPVDVGIPQIPDDIVALILLSSTRGLSERPNES